MLSPAATVALILASCLLPLSSAASPQTPGTYSIPINYTLGDDAKFVATFAVGSQETEMQIIMDLGSYIPWVYGPNELVWGNQSNNGPYNCHVEWTPFYSPDASTTATLTTESLDTSYGGGAKIVTGDTLAIDTLSTTDCSGEGPRLPFYVVNSTTVRQLDTLACQHVPADYDGIFGLAIPANATTGFRYSVQHPPAPQEPLIDSATMSVFLRNTTTTPALQPMQGEVLLGGIDESAFVGPLVSIANASINPYYGLFYVPLPTLSVAGVNVTLDPALAEDNGGCIVDSGTSDDIWPIDLFSSTYQYQPEAFLAETGLLGLTGPNGTSVWAYPSACADIPANATFDFAWSSPSGKDITIQVPIRNYARDNAEVNADSCALNLDQVGCTLGAPFLSGAYFFVDNDSGVIALAQAGEGHGPVVAIKSGEDIPGLVV